MWVPCSVLPQRDDDQSSDNCVNCLLWRPVRWVYVISHFPHEEAARAQGDVQMAIPESPEELVAVAEGDCLW